MPTSSRIAATRALHAVFGQGRRIQDAWDQGLAREDAVFAQALLGLCVRHWGRLQAWVRPRLKTPDRGLPLGSAVALAQGLAQLAWLDGVSAHAAVNESVALVADSELGFPPHRGLLNALLRKASTDRAALKAELEALPAGLDRTPFVDRALQSALGPGADGEAREDLWRRLRTPPSITFRALNDAPLPEGLLPVPHFSGALRLAPGAPFPRPWLASGAGMVQDLSSQALMAFHWDTAPSRIADLCAAPGGKTVLLAKRWPDASLYALEQDAARARRLTENLATRNVHAHVLAEEAAAWLELGGRAFDLILLDAPCSGSGTIQKHPELAWIGDRIDLDRLAARQRRLIQAALPRLAPGGLLIYAVCSWLPEECEAHHLWLEQTAPDLRPAPVWPAALTEPDGARSSVFKPDPRHWDGEGFQAFAMTRIP